MVEGKRYVNWTEETFILVVIVSSNIYFNENIYINSCIDHEMSILCGLKPRRLFCFRIYTPEINV